MDVEVSSTQVFRVANLYGAYVGSGPGGRLLEPVSKDKVLYALQRDLERLQPVASNKGHNDHRQHHIIPQSHQSKNHPES